MLKQFRPRLTREELIIIEKFRTEKDGKQTTDEVKELSPLAADLFAYIKRKTKQTPSIDALADVLETSPKKIKAAVSELRDFGYNVEAYSDKVIYSQVVPKRPDYVVDVAGKTKGVYKFGALGDNHLCSKYERLDVLHSLYDLYEQEGITDVYNTGNWIDGEARFNKHDIHTHGLDNQLNYMLNHYPLRDGITTHYVGGDDHEGWYVQQMGIDVGFYLEKLAIQKGRTDLRYLGYMENDVILKAPKGETRLRVVHPGGGSSYAISYTMQKLVESLQEGEKPNVILAGHYHKHGYQQIRGVHTFQTGTTQDQTPFMRKKKISAHVGGWIIELHTDEKGAVIRVKSEWIPFFNKDYYGKTKNWAYQFGDQRAI